MVIGLDQLRVAQLQQLSFIIFLRSLWRLVVQLETHGVFWGNSIVQQELAFSAMSQNPGTPMVP